MKKLIVFVFMWVAIGYSNYHYTLGYFSHMFPYQDHISTARFMAMGGPLAIPAVYMDTPLRWQDKPFTCEERWEFFRRAGYSGLGVDYLNRQNNCDLSAKYSLTY